MRSRDTIMLFGPEDVLQRHVKDLEAQGHMVIVVNTTEQDLLMKGWGNPITASVAIVGLLVASGQARKYAPLPRHSSLPQPNARHESIGMSQADSISICETQSIQMTTSYTDTDISSGTESKFESE